jgi:hypothetical protein
MAAMRPIEYSFRFLTSSVKRPMRYCIPWWPQRRGTDQFLIFQQETANR